MTVMTCLERLMINQQLFACPQLGELESCHILTKNSWDSSLIMGTSWTNRQIKMEPATHKLYRWPQLYGVRSFWVIYVPHAHQISIE